MACPAYPLISLHFLFLPTRTTAHCPLMHMYPGQVCFLECPSFLPRDSSPLTHPPVVSTSMALALMASGEQPLSSMELPKRPEPVSTPAPITVHSVFLSVPIVDGGPLNGSSTLE